MDAARLSAGLLPPSLSALGGFKPPWPGSQDSLGPYASLIMKPGPRPIAGFLPTEWQDMGALQTLYLMGNALSGTLPQG